MGLGGWQKRNPERDAGAGSVGAEGVLESLTCSSAVRALGKAVLRVQSAPAALGEGCGAGGHLKVSEAFADFTLDWKCCQFILLWEVQKYNQE